MFLLSQIRHTNHLPGCFQNEDVAHIYLLCFVYHRYQRLHDNLLGSLIGGILMFLLLYFAARWATETDPQILRFLLTSPKLRTQYDPAKFSPISIRRITNA